MGPSESQTKGLQHFTDYCESLAVAVGAYTRRSETALTVDVGQGCGLSRVVITSAVSESNRLDLIAHLNRFTHSRLPFFLVVPKSLFTLTLQDCVECLGLRSGEMLRWPSMVRPCVGEKIDQADPVAFMTVLVRTDNDAGDWRSIVSDAFANAHRRSALGNYLRTYTASLPAGTDLFLLRDGETAVATAATHVDRCFGIRGLYWVATTPSARRRGYSRRLLTYIIDAFPGQEIRLQAMGQAVNLYSSLGFISDDSYLVYLPHYRS